MKTILIFTQEYLHSKQPPAGGTGSFYKKYTSSLLEKGYKVVIFGNSSIALNEQDGNLRICFLKRNYFKKHFIQELFRSLGKRLKIAALEAYFLKKEVKDLTNKLKEFLKKENIRPDIIETHDWNGISLFLDELSIPYVVRAHGCYKILNKYFGYNITLGLSLIESEALKKAPHLVCVSKNSQQMYEETFGKTGTIITNGVDCSHKPISSDTIPFSVFFFGTAMLKKGFDTALNVFNRLRERFPEATLHIVGKNYEIYLRENHLEEIKNVVNYGFLDGDELKEVLQKASVFIFPSRGETFGLALCEAMALGKAVVAADIPSFRDIITHKEDGFIARNEDEYYEYIAALFEDASLNKSISEKAQQTIEHQYNFEKTVKNSLAYYQKIINTK